MRETRQWSEASRKKLSASTRGKAKSAQTRERIRQSMIRYWQTIPNEQIPMTAPRPAKPVTQPQPQQAPQPFPSMMELERNIERYSRDIPVKKVRIPEKCINPQPVPPEPTIKNDHGIWEEITKDLITYQGEENAQKAENNYGSNGKHRC